MAVDTRAALSGRAQGQGKSRDGNVEAIRALVVAKRSGRSTKIQTLNQIRHLGFTAPEELRSRLKGISRQHLGAEAAALRPRAGGDPVVFATKTALSLLGHRVLVLDAERERLNLLLGELVKKTAPQLLEIHGVGVDTAASLLVTAGDNPGRIRSEAAWAHLCGVSPIPASSGKVTRVRLDRGGDRQANSALWGVVITRLRSDPRTEANIERRRKRAVPSPRSSESSSATSPARSITACLADSSLPAAGLARESAGTHVVALITICRSAAGSPPSPLRGRNIGLVRACPHRVAHPCLARAGRRRKPERTRMSTHLHRRLLRRRRLVTHFCRPDPRAV